MTTVRSVDEQGYREAADALGIALPVEQLPVWQAYEATIPGREPWGYVLIEEDGEPVAVAAFMDYETHGYHYLRAHHGPAWAQEPTYAQEQAAIKALVDHVRSTDKKVAFIRCAVSEPYESTHAVLSTLPYDTTVVVDTTGDEEQILSRFKTRGRRDVRKSLRECPLATADETEQATRDFSEYYDVMVETGERDGFAPAPKEDYRSLLEILGPEHARLFAARDDEGRLKHWAIDILNAPRATHLYGAMANDAMRTLGTEKLIFAEMLELNGLGVEAFDLMGIGSDFQPALRGLNTFKTKFAKEATRVAPDRDIPVKKGFYRALTGLQNVRRKLRSR